ncbi:hypothetical protein GCM10007878_22070 [Marinospirillum insulare]|uniref:Uncharacterized protein n=2 Tax=Marinospirillum insulare TaxID=217169 RepID=A0ABQ6A3T9_9GAMM|nr:hypothetical protein GCM10007878_22070 [Marinospirillum insulare]
MAAQPTLPLKSGQILNATSVSQVVLNEGETRSNLWFSIETNRVEGTSTYHLSNCTLSADVKLQAGQFNLQTKQLRCISDKGDIFTDKDIQAQILATTNELCTSKQGSCSEVTLHSGSSYTFEVKNASELVAEFNAMREVNKSRLEMSN